MISVFAYIDPGSGALLWQTLTAAAIGTMFYIRRFILKIRGRKRDH